MYSACDCGNIIAEHVSGSVDAFVELMNERAVELGATHTHFVNTHGLTAEDHYSTAYDLYLIFNEVVKYPKYNEISHQSKYVSTYINQNGEEASLELYTTNLYLRSEATPPSGITVIGGKTGTTDAAGNCIILYVEDSYGNHYISVIMGSTRRATLYEQMTLLLKEI